METRDIIYTGMGVGALGSLGYIIYMLKGMKKEFYELKDHVLNNKISKNNNLEKEVKSH